VYREKEGEKEKEGAQSSDYSTGERRGNSAEKKKKGRERREKKDILRNINFCGVLEEEERKEGGEKMGGRLDSSLSSIRH